MSKIEEKIVKAVQEDFKARAQERRPFDIIWQINMNFLMGNQYCNVGFGGNMEEQERQFFWQEREVFNHIAPIYDIRYAKLSSIKPDINIIPATNDERDKQSAKLSKKIFKSVKNRLAIDEKINQAIKWSEVCGTVFYKVGWNSKSGLVIGRNEDGSAVRSGEVDFSVVSPFEIYPDNLTCERIEDCQSIIHAKVYPVSVIKSMYGVSVKGENVRTFSLDGAVNSVGGLGYNGTTSKMIDVERKDSAIVIERYEKESEEYPFGRLTIVAGDKLIYDGELPFAVGTDGKRDFPFIKQTSNIEPGRFWGTSVIERLVPVQRAYNAVKNRKHEFINRLSLGVLSVEDGSVDLDNLQQDGLCPGKVLVYRQGAVEPKYLQGENLPSGINQEEEFLLEEFTKISGVSDLVNAGTISSNISGFALELMINQDQARLNASVESIKSATKEIASKILKLYKQYAIMPRLERIVGENGEIEMFYFSSSDISSDDIVIENQTDEFDSVAKRREMLFKLLEHGVLVDENGVLSPKMKSKIVEMLGMGVWENAQDIEELHTKKAESENLKLLNGGKVKVSEIDNHSLHISSHIAFMLGQDFEKMCLKNEQLEEEFLSHIRQHKKMKGE